jgi:hypothetical protein
MSIHMLIEPFARYSDPRVGLCSVYGQQGLSTQKSGWCCGIFAISAATEVTKVQK